MPTLMIHVEGKKKDGIRETIHVFEKIEYPIVPRIGEQIMIDDNIGMWRLKVRKIVHILYGNAIYIATKKIDLIEYNLDK